MTQQKEVADPKLRYLRQFQSDRLRGTYAELALEPGYEEACEFFFGRLYSTEDTTDRDEKFRSIYTNAKKILSEEMVTTVDQILELNDLSHQLDQRVLGVLTEHGHPHEFDMETYEHVYFLSDNFDERIRQIELIEFGLQLVHRYSQRRGVGLILRGLRKTPVFGGEGGVADFLLDGYKAFVDVKDMNYFTETIVQTEIERLNRIYRR